MSEALDIPVDGSITLSNLSANRLVITNSSKLLANTNLINWITAVPNQTTITDDGIGGLSIGTAQSIGTLSSPSFTGLTLSGLTASTLLSLTSGKALQSATVGDGLTFTSNTLAISGTSTKTITTQSMQTNSSSTNITNTSASAAFPVLFGSIKEIYCAPGNSVINFNVGGGVGSMLVSGAGVNRLQVFNSAGTTSGNIVNLAIPGTQEIGVYMVEYTFEYAADRGITNVSFKGNGSDSYTNIRTGIDGYRSAPAYVRYVDYFTVSTAGTIDIRWTNNGKNASATNYYIVVGGIIVTKLG